MKRILSIFSIYAFLFSLLSCQQDNDVTNIQNNNTQKNINQATEGIIPFTVANVRNALPIVLDYYKTQNPDIATKFSGYLVNTTHIYYKFTPKDSLQYITLMQDDENLQLTTDPFEYSVKDRITDPAEDEIPAFYAVVDKEYNIPDVPHDIIAELHFTDEDRLEEDAANYDEIEFKQNLMYQARKLAGHLDSDEIAEGYTDYRTNLKGLRWRPSGNVKTEDDWLSERKGVAVNLPVNRVRVNVLRHGWIRVESGTTDANGNFSTGRTYTQNVHYNVKFTDHGRVRILAGNFYDMANWRSGNHRRKALNVTFVKNTVHQFYALINNAAWDYFNRVVPTYGIHNPQFIQISGHYNDSQSNYYFDAVPFRSEVKLGGRNSDGTRKKSDNIYATVIHEITHKSHFKLSPGCFVPASGSSGKNKLFLRESWAECVETIATNDKYQQYFTQYSITGGYIASTRINFSAALVRTWNGDRQYETIAQMNEYTPLLIDLTENYNQNGYNSIYHQDLASGYSLFQIQHALIQSNTATTFYDKLYNNVNNNTKQHLQTLKNHANTVISNL